MSSDTLYRKTSDNVKKYIIFLKKNKINDEDKLNLSRYDSKNYIPSLSEFELNEKIKDIKKELRKFKSDVLEFGKLSNGYIITKLSYFQKYSKKKSEKKSEKMPKKFSDKWQSKGEFSQQFVKKEILDTNNYLESGHTLGRMKKKITNHYKEISMKGHEQDIMIVLDSEMKNFEMLYFTFEFYNKVNKLYDLMLHSENKKEQEKTRKEINKDLNKFNFKKTEKSYVFNPFGIVFIHSLKVKNENVKYL